MASNAALKTERDQWTGASRTRSDSSYAFMQDAERRTVRGNAAGKSSGSGNVKTAGHKQAKAAVKKHGGLLQTKTEASHSMNNAVRKQKTAAHAVAQAQSAGRLNMTGNRAAAYNAAARSPQPSAKMRNIAAMDLQRTPAQAVQPIRKQGLYYDYSLLCTLIFIFALGLLIIYSSSQYTAQLEKAGDSAYYFTRQLQIGGAGLAAAFLASFLDYRFLSKLFNGVLVKIAYWGANGLLAATLVMGVASHGKMRWITIAGQRFQPAEVAKIAIIMYVSWFIAKKGRNFKRRENILHVIGCAAIPTALILTQNISSAIIVALITAVMIFVAVDNKKIFAILGGFALGAVALLKPAIAFVIAKTGYSTRPDAYYLRRVLGWAAPDVFPDDAYQTLQSLYAIGSGGMRGHGLGESIQKFGKIPEVQNDMIFSIVCEEFGFLGAAMIVILFLYLIYRISIIAKNAEDLFGSMLCTGVMAHIGIQTVLNIAVVTGVIPNTGVTLPFISYGGTAVLLTMLEMGIVLSVAHRIPKQQ